MIAETCICDAPAALRPGQDKAPLVPVETVQARLAASAICLAGVETQPLSACQGRILASNVYANQTVPPHDNSAMDGYGIRFADTRDSLAFSVSQRVPAGSAPEPLVPGTAVRIFTGAPIPAGVDTVVPQENVEILENRQVRLKAQPGMGQNIRRAGEDVSLGDALLPAGSRLEAAEIGLLASQGRTQVEVRKRLRVCVLTTGDELVAPGQLLAPGQIYNSNAYTLTAALERLGCEVQQMTTVADSLAITRGALARAARTCDLVITTGGVSVGDEDHVRRAVETLGSLNTWGIAMKPGKPFAFGEVSGAPFVGLPGNPMAALVTFEILVIDHVRRLMGALTRTLRPFPVRAGFSRQKTIARQEYLRVRLSYHPNDHQNCHQAEPVAQLAGSQSSGVLSVASLSDGYLLVPAHRTIEEGECYGFISRNQLYH